MSIAQRDSMVSARPRRVSHVALIGEWFEVERGVWVGSASGIYLGRVEAIDAGFRAIDESNVWVEDFAELKDALAGLEHPSRGADR